MDDREPFGQVLRQLRLAAGLTHEALAERASLGARTISDLERGVSRAPRMDTLALLVAALGATAEQRVRLEAAARLAADARPAVDPANGLGRLPAPLTSFVGREREAGIVLGFLRRDDIRLVTLTGPGGVGKTRLALHVAARAAGPRFAEVVAVDLAPARGADDALRAMLRASGAPDDGPDPGSRLASVIGGRRVLLLLDNFEHLLAVAPRVADLLRACPRLTVLATSRAPLRLSAEQEFPVQPLPTPDPAAGLPFAALEAYPAVGLFVDRAARVRPDFALTADNAGAVAGICSLLDGLPLALELAAARTPALPPAALLARLRGSGLPSLGLLGSGCRDAPARQQTLRDAIAWSHDLLPVHERVLFRRLSVFAGGCTPDAAAAICAPPADPGAGEAMAVSPDAAEFAVLDGLQALIDASLLVLVPGPDGTPRYRMLETIRSFAWERLAASGEDAIVQQRHAAHYLSLVEATGALLFASERARAAHAGEQANVQAAFRWLVMHG